MPRKPGTNQQGLPFSAAIINAVWNKAKPVDGIDPFQKRKDSCGAWIDRTHHGIHTENGTGWEIDHIRPVIDGGTDNTNNLQPLQWQNNREKADQFPYWTCNIEAESG